MALIIPKNYKSKLNYMQMQSAIKYIRDTFQNLLEIDMGLTRVSAPLFVPKSTGLNDNLSGKETPVSFHINGVDDDVEIVHSLAKWKRFALHQYGFKPEEGLYTNMCAIRKDEELDNLHSAYVDQWDWERVITTKQRNYDRLVFEVRKIHEAIKKLQAFFCENFATEYPSLMDEIFVVTTQELLDIWPNLTPKERENKICKDKGSVLLTQIGRTLSDGSIHDNRAPDYDDWEMNGDILYWFEPLQCALEISSMGVRVNENSIVSQLEQVSCPERKVLPYHQGVINKELPYTVGGGIGQSRLCMLITQCAHVGEVQASIWPREMIKSCRDNGINIL